MAWELRDLWNGNTLIPDDLLPRFNGGVFLSTPNNALACALWNQGGARSSVRRPGDRRQGHSKQARYPSAPR